MTAEDEKPKDEMATERSRAYDDARRAGAGMPAAPARAAAALRRGDRVRIAACVFAAAVAAVVVIVGIGAPTSTRIVSAVAAGLAGLLAAAVLTRALAELRSEHAQLAQRETAALRMAELDELTGLGNYRMFSRQLAAEVARSRRHEDPFSLVLLDLDGFKAINDELGHLAGDDALRHVAAALREALREEDVCCRQGGDEFAVIAVRAGEEEVSDLSLRLVHAIEQIPFGLDGARRLGACAGWATFGEPARSADELILRADAALREAKGHMDGSSVAPARGVAPRRAARRRSSRLGSGEVARLTLLSGLARALAGARDERALAETTLAFLGGAIDAIGTTVLMAGPGAGGERPNGRARTATVIALGTDGLGAGAGAELAARTSVQRALAAAGTAVVEQDQPDATWVDGSRVRSELAVAVLDGARIWGCLLVACDRPDAYGPAERALAEAMAQQLGRALSCRRLLDKLSVSRFGELYWIAAVAEAECGVGDARADAPIEDAEQWRLADLAWQVGRALELDGRALRALYLAALFHDVGTVGVPATLLAYPGELHVEERVILREHSLIGERMLRALPLLRDAAPLVRQAHERWDGGGYPDGLAGEQIALEARILLACEVLVAMTSPRPWRPARPLDAARSELRRVAGAQLDPRVVATLLHLLEHGDASGGGVRDLDGDERATAPARV